MLPGYVMELHIIDRWGVPWEFPLQILLVWQLNKYNSVDAVTIMLDVH